MGVLDALKKRERAGIEDLEKAKQQVKKKIEEKTEGEESEIIDKTNNPAIGGDPKTKKTVSLKDYKNINDAANSEMRIIKILNEIDNLKAKIDENTTKILKEVKNVDTDIDSLGDLVSSVPKQTMEELANIKKNQPAMYYKLKELISEKVRASVVDMIDANILKIINKAGKITSHDLLAKAEAMHACSKNTLYGHLKDLYEKGMVIKRRQGHEVIYSVNEEVAKAMEEASTTPEEDSAKREETKDSVKEEPTKPAAVEMPKKAKETPTEKESASPEKPKAAVNANSAKPENIKKQNKPVKPVAANMKQNALKKAEVKTQIAS